MDSLLGKTHMMVGIAATLALSRPQSVAGIITAAGVGAVGALISDIDVGTSASHKDADKVVGLTVIVVIATIALEYFTNIKLLDKVANDSGTLRIVLGVILFVAVCAFGKEQPHRSFMHSFLALALLDIAIGLVYVPFVPYFTIGFLSHLATDIFNRRKVRLLYPLKGGVSLNLFHAHGTANNVFFAVGSFVSAAEVVLLLLNR